MSDRELRELAREAALAAHDPGPHVAHAHALLRVGAREDAAGAFYRARALGAEGVVTSAGLRALGAPVAPWSHVHGDSANARRAWVRGPRRGEVVARAKLSKGHAIVTGEGGTVLVAQSGATIARFDGGTLVPRGEGAVDGSWNRAWPAVLPGGRLVATTSGNDSGLYVLDRESGDPRCVELGASFNRHFQLPVADWERAVVVRSGATSEVRVARSSSADLEPEVVFGAGPYASDPALRGDRVAVFIERGREWALRTFDLRWGDEWATFELDGPPRREPVLDGEVRALVVSGGESREGHATWTLRCVSPDGEEEWRRAFSGLDTDGAPRVALAGDGHSYVAFGGALARLDRSGSVAWKIELAVRSALVVDRDGVVYATVESPERRSLLAAVAPDGASAFTIPGDLHPLALDAWGRLLAIGPREPVSKSELVAIE